MFADYHVHCHFSDDSNYPMEQVILDAIAKGIDEICFTDHVDYGVKADWDTPEKIRYIDGSPYTNVDYPNYFQKIETFQQKYKDKITIKKGLEFGIQTHTIPLYEKLIEKYPMDFVILSIHQIQDKEFWNQEFQKEKSQAEYNRQYYQEMLDIVQKFKGYSVLGHMDLITRYDTKGVYPFENVKDLIEEILKIVIADGKGIEINTSSKRYGLSDTTPSQAILKLYLELGGTIITLGSDSHKPEHLGAYIQETKAMLKELGFTHYSTFTQGKAQVHPLYLE